MTPDEIYIRAVEAQRARPVPAYADYDVAVRTAGAAIGCPHGQIVVTFGGAGSERTYRVAYRGPGQPVRSVDAATDEPCLGAPLIEPGGGDIGKLLQPANAPADRPTDAPAGTLPIATVRAIGVAHYAVLSSVDEMLNGRAVFHLALRALTDAQTYPLTDLYVDADDFHIARVVGHFVDRFGGAPATIAATGDFEIFGAYSIETHERVEFSAETQPHRTRATLEASASNLRFRSPR